MKKFFVARASLVVALLSVALAQSGCKSCGRNDQGPPTPYSIEIDLDAALANDSVAVDVVGVTPANLPRWQNYSMTKYWESGDELRQDADKVTLVFGEGKPATQTVKLDGARWTSWQARGITNAAVLAHLPGIFEDKPDPLDARRQILSLCKCSWPDGTNTIVLDIKRSGIEIRTVPRQRN